MSECKQIVFYEDINNPGMARVIEEEVRYWYDINKETMKIKHSIFGIVRNLEAAGFIQKCLIIHYEGEAGLNPFDCGHEHHRIEVIDPARCEHIGTSDKWCDDCKIYLGRIYPDALEHIYEYVSNLDATCLEDGTNTGTCTLCGKEIIVPDPGSALGHNHIYTYNQNATCLEDGTETGICSRCNDTVVRVKPNTALGHDYQPFYNNDATCLEDGTNTFRCSRCDANYTETALNTALGHNYPSTWTIRTPATCTTDGLQYKRCTRCGHEITEVIPATGHTPVPIPAVPATCTATGLTEGSKCSVCGTILKAQTTVPATGHDWDTPTYTWSGYTSCTAKRVCKNCGATETATATITSVVTKAATCTATGTKTYTAKFSNSVFSTQTKVETLAALGHNFSSTYTTDVAATCTTAGSKSQHCSRCDAKQNVTSIAALGHSYPSSWTVRTAATVSSTGVQYKRCTRCGHEITETIPKLAVTITTSSINGMVTRTAFSQTLATNAPSGTWALSSGTLPPGISLSSAGKLSGTPTSVGLYTFTVKVTYDSRSATKTFSIQVAAGLVTVTFNANGGTCSEKTRKISQGSNIGTLPTPTYSGQVFGGWFTAATGGLKVDASYSVNSDVTLYARWGASSDIVFGDATTQFNMQYEGDRTNYNNNPYTIYGRIAGVEDSTASLVFQTGIASTDGTNNMTSSNKKITLYLKVTNNGDAGYFDIGFDADSYVVNVSNDQVPIKRIAKGLEFGNGIYTVTVPYTHTAWAGKYSSRTTNRYVDLAVNTLISGLDTGFAFTMNNIFINSASYTILEVTFQRP